MGTTLADSSISHLPDFFTDFLQTKTASGGLSTRQKSVRMIEEKHKQNHSCPGLDKRGKDLSTVTSALVQRWEDRRLIAQKEDFRDAVRLPGVKKS